MRGAALLSLVLIAGCVAQSEGPTANTGTITGEVGDPRNRARVHTELASIYYERGSMGVALEELRLAQAADRTYAPAHSLFGLVYMELRETKLAEESFQRALGLSPTDPEINHNFGWFLCQNSREKESIGYFMQAVRNPLYAAPWRSYAAAGSCSLRTNNVREAEDYFQRALKLDPDEPTSLLQLGKIRYRQGDIADARRLLSRHMKLASPNAEALWLAVRIERRVGERVAEQSYANQLRRRFPGSPEYQAMQRGQYE
jgi:type IV pilus assembly protein PilF